MSRVEAFAEYERRELDLTPRELDGLLAAVGTSGTLAISPTRAGTYQVTASSLVGAVVSSDITVLIRPKIRLRNLFYLLGMTSPRFETTSFAYGDERDLLQAMAGIFAHEVDRTTVRGVLHGYRAREERLVAPRGRIDLVEQLRRPALVTPTACRFDEFTPDILPNRALLAACLRLLRVPGLRSEQRAHLRGLMARFDEVSPVDVQPDRLDQWRPTRLDRHYEVAVRFASIILRNLSLRDVTGGRSAASFTINMNDVFQRFVADGLRRRLRGELEVVEEPPTRFAVKQGITMLPDLVFRRRGQTVFVGDAKYKLSSGPARLSDYYQLLAYAAVLEQPAGVLVYCQADDELPGAVHEVVVRNDGRRLFTYRLQLGGSFEEIEGELAGLADWIAHTVARQVDEFSTVA